LLLILTRRKLVVGWTRVALRHQLTEAEAKANQSETNLRKRGEKAEAKAKAKTKAKRMGKRNSDS